MQQIKQHQNQISQIKEQLDRQEVSFNRILGGYVSYISPPCFISTSSNLRQRKSKSMFKQTINYLYSQERQIAYQINQNEKVKNQKMINDRLLQYLNKKSFFVEKIFSNANKNFSYGRKVNFRTVNIQRKYNSQISTSLHMLKQAQQINNYKMNINRQLSSLHTSPMVQKLQKNVGLMINKPKQGYRIQHPGRLAFFTLNNSPVKTKNPSLRNSQQKSYKAKNRNKQNQGIVIKRNPLRKYQQLKAKVNLKK